ncbi:hypothetical protein [Spirochaeta dissipatitropha]
MNTVKRIIENRSVARGYLTVVLPAVLFSILVTVPITSQSVPGITDIRSAIEEAEQNVLLSRNPEHSAYLLDQAEMDLLQLALERNLHAGNQLISSLLARIGSTRARIRQLQAHESAGGRVIRTIDHIEVPQAGKVARPAREPEDTRQEEPLQEDPLPKEPQTAALISSQEFRAELNAINTDLRSIYTSIYSRGDYDGMDEALTEQHNRLLSLGQRAGENASAADLQRAKDRVDEYRSYLHRELERLGVFQEQPAERTIDPASPFAEAESVFRKYQDSIPALDQVVRQIAQYRNADEVREIMPRWSAIKQESDQLIAELWPLLPDGNSRNAFARENQKAREMNLWAFMGGFESQLDRAEGRVAMYVSGLLNQAYVEADTILRYDRIDLAAASYERALQQSDTARMVLPDDQDIRNRAEEIKLKAERNFETARGRLGNARMARDMYEGSDRESIIRRIKELYEQQYSGEVIKAVIISEAWDEQLVAETDNDGRITANYYLYLYAQAAVRRNGKYFVFPLGFRRSWTGRGTDYGPIELRSIGVSFPILPENL